MKQINQNTIDQMTINNHNDEDQGTTHTGGLPIRTDLRAGISIEDIQGQVSSWWQNLSSSLSLPGSDSSQSE